MEREKVMALSLAIIAHELGTEPSKLRVLRFCETKSGALDEYLKENGVSFHQYQLGERA